MSRLRDLQAIQAATDVVHGELTATPVVRHPLLDALLGSAAPVKHENVLPTGAFKVRGGVHLASRLSLADRRAGLVTTSTGNHAQSVAYAAALAGSRAVVVMPLTAPANKQAAVEALGATVVRHGVTLTESAAHAQAYAAEQGMRYVAPTDPDIVLGHATLYLELFTQVADLDTVYVPIGSGTGAVGACLVRDVLQPTCRVVGVQSSAAPAAYDSWTQGRVVSAACTTRASGLATATGFECMQQVLRARLDDFVLVSDDEIDAARRLLATHAHTLAEGAGAASLAGLLADPRATPGGRHAVVCTGGNADADELMRLAAA